MCDDCLVLVYSWYRAVSVEVGVPGFDPSIVLEVLDSFGHSAHVDSLGDELLSMDAVPWTSLLRMLRKAGLGIVDCSAIRKSLLSTSLSKSEVLCVNAGETQPTLHTLLVLTLSGLFLQGFAETVAADTNEKQIPTGRYNGVRKAYL